MKIAIIGLGQVGLSLARHFLRQKNGDEILAVDDKASLAELDPAWNDLPIEFFLNGDQPKWAEVQQCYISPGVSPLHPSAAGASACGLKLLGELDLLANLTQVPVIAITGTNGKSTTTSLIGHLLSQAGLKIGLGGNLGEPMLNLQDPTYDFLVLELSSFQLESIERFRPKIAVLLNFSDDHYDRHMGMPAYVAAKAKIFSRQQDDDAMVYNADDLNVLKAVSGAKAKAYPFSLVKKTTSAYASAENLHLLSPEGELVFKMSDTKLTGLHNMENILAAVSAASLAGLNHAQILSGLASFKGLPHRLEWVAKMGEVEFYDDSKGTNVGAVLMSLASFSGDVVLIAGGRDKGGDYAPLKSIVKNKCKGLVLIGEAASLMATTLQHCTKTIIADSMESAVQQAVQLVDGKGVILLSPACSSFDMFKNYHHRGMVYQECVKKIVEVSSAAN